MAQSRAVRESAPGECLTMAADVSFSADSGAEKEVGIADGADVDGDGEITGMDLAVLQMYIAGDDVTLGPVA